MDSVGNQTFFTKSKILEKAVNQVQNDGSFFVVLKIINNRGFGGSMPLMAQLWLEIFNILRKFTRSCAEKFLKKCSKSSFVQRLFLSFGSFSFFAYAIQRKKMNVKKNLCLMFHPFFDAKNGWSLRNFSTSYFVHTKSNFHSSSATRVVKIAKVVR